MKTEYLERLRVSPAAKMAPWLFITSAEVAQFIGVHLQTISNWRLRGKGPTPAPESFFKGRPRRYMVAHVFAWAAEQAGEVVEPWKLNATWLQDNMEFANPNDRAAVQSRVSMLMRLSRDFRPGQLTPEGRAELITETFMPSPSQTLGSFPSHL